MDPKVKDLLKRIFTLISTLNTDKLNGLIDKISKEDQKKRAESKDFMDGVTFGTLMGYAKARRVFKNEDITGSDEDKELFE